MIKTRPPIETCRLFLFVGAMLFAFATNVSGQGVDEHRKLLREGSYDKLIATLEPALDTQPEQNAADNDASVDRAELLVLADAYRAVGRDEDARQLWYRIISADDVISSIARSRLGALELEIGDRRLGHRLLSQSFDHYQRNSSDYDAYAALAAADAVASLADIDPALAELALNIYESAIELAPKDAATHTAIGDYLLARYNGGEAMDAYQDALEIDAGFVPALYGTAHVMQFDRQSAKANEALNFLLEVQSNYVPAHLLRARLAIDADDYSAAEAAIAKALETQPESIRALSLQAAVHYMRDEVAQFDAITEGIRRRAPGYVGLYLLLAEVAAQHRRYFDAVDFSTIAVNLHPRAWRGHALLGINRLRLGDISRGRLNLERSFRGNPFDVWTKNTLDLLDVVDKFPLETSDRFILAADPDEIDVLAPYLLPLAEAAFDRFQAKYDYTPTTPIRIEVYPDHKDFSVRTVGLVGVDIIGVSFGPVVALDSPSSREFGDFNWASVLWHEIAHSFHIEMSAGKVPRWFTEGLSVYEERLGREGWGGDVSESFLTAFRDGRLAPASDLDQAFLRPTYPEQVPHAYYQASLIMEMIDARFGFDAIVNMLSGFADGVTNKDMIRDVLGLTSQEFDQAFDEFVQAKLGRAIEAIGTGEDGSDGAYSELMQAAAQALDDDIDYALAESKLLEAQALFPERAGPGSSYRELAALYLFRGDLELAARQLEMNINIDADDLEAHQRLAAIYKRQSNTEALGDLLERSLQIQPFDAEIHSTLGDLYAARGDWQRAVGARAATMSLDPRDAIKSRYQYAEALHRTEQPEAARHEILRTLEVAPMYGEALDLLLEMNDSDQAQNTVPMEENSE